MRLILFGNPAIQSDSLALKVGEKLKNDFETTHLGSPFDLLARIENDPKFFDDAVILDVAHGIDEPKLFQDLDKLRTIRLGSLHDFDMAFFIKLLNRVGKLEPPRILALPQGMGVAEASEASLSLLKSL